MAWLVHTGAACAREAETRLKMPSPATAITLKTSPHGMWGTMRRSIRSCIRPPGRGRAPGERHVVQARRVGQRRDVGRVLARRRVGRVFFLQVEVLLDDRHARGRGIHATVATVL